MLRAAFGAIPGAVTEIIERDDGFIYAQRPDRYFAPPSQWLEFERSALSLIGDSGAVLDVGCGAGRFALALQDLGVAVTALDVSAGAVSVARARGVRSVVQGTVADQGLGSYDCFLLMGENLGLLEGRSRGPSFLAELAAIARPGARIIGHGADPAFVPGLPDPLPGRLRGEMTLRVRYRDIATEWFGYLLCSPSELDSLCDGTPWELTSADYADSANYVAVLKLTGLRPV